MQSRNPSNMNNKDKEICRNYMKGSCPHGKECWYIHPEVCKYFLQNKCKRGNECPFLHKKPKPEKQHKQQRSEWLTFCVFFPNGECRNKECRYLHVAEEDKENYRKSGQVAPHLLEQAMCKALLQDAKLDGRTPICKEFLRGHCEWMSCAMLHINKHEYSDRVQHLLQDKFELIIGSHGGRMNPSFRSHEPYNFDRTPPFTEPYGRERHDLPKNFDRALNFTEPYGRERHDLPKNFDRSPNFTEPYGRERQDLPKNFDRAPPFTEFYGRERHDVPKNFDRSPNFTEPYGRERHDVPKNFDRSPNFTEPYGRERQDIPKNFDRAPPFTEPYGHERLDLPIDKVGMKASGSSASRFDLRIDGKGDCERQDFVSTETDRIIKGVYNLMKRDTSYMRNSESQEITDLRWKLDRLAEENAKYRFEFSRSNNLEMNPLFAVGAEDFRYQDVIRRLERENMEMKHQLSAVNKFQPYPRSSGFKGQGYPPHDSRKYGLPSHSGYGAPQNLFNPKGRNQVKQSMYQQQKKPYPVKQGPPQNAKNQNAPNNKGPNPKRRHRTRASKYTNTEKGPQFEGTNADNNTEDMDNDIEGEITNADNDTEVEVTNMDNDIEGEITNADNDTEVEVTNMDNDIEGEITIADNDTEVEVTNMDNDIEGEITNADNDIESEVTKANTSSGGEVVDIENCSESEGEKVNFTEDHIKTLHLPMDQSEKELYPKVKQHTKSDNESVVANVENISESEVQPTENGALNIATDMKNTTGNAENMQMSASKMDKDSVNNGACFGGEGHFSEHDCKEKETDTCNMDESSKMVKASSETTENVSLDAENGKVSSVAKSSFSKAEITSEQSSTNEPSKREQQSEHSENVENYIAEVDDVK